MHKRLMPASVWSCVLLLCLIPYTQGPRNRYGWISSASSLLLRCHRAQALWIDQQVSVLTDSVTDKVYR